MDQAILAGLVHRYGQDRGQASQALVRDLLTEANGARQGQRTPDVPVGCAGFKPRPGNALRCFVCGQRKRDHS
jgi:hypothetical protein